MNFQKKMGVKLGDKVTYTTKDKKEMTGVVYGFFDYFPSYVKQTHELNQQDTLVTTDHYLIVANLAPVQQTLGVKPYGFRPTVLRNLFTIMRRKTVSNIRCLRMWHPNW